MLPVVVISMLLTPAGIVSRCSSVWVVRPAGRTSVPAVSFSHSSQPGAQSSGVVYDTSGVGPMTQGPTPPPPPPGGGPPMSPCAFARKKAPRLLPDV